MNNKYSTRIKTLASLVDPGSSVLDVGTDHAYLPIYLIKNKLVKSACGSDVSKNVIDIAKKNVSEARFSKEINIYLSDGLEDVNDYYDTLIIAGMGFNTIKKILENKNICNTLIIQSNSDHEGLRIFMNSLNYVIDKELVIKDKGKYYVIIKYKKGIEKLKKYELCFGKSNNNDYFNYLKEKNMKLLKEVPLRKKINFYKNVYYLNVLLKKSER